MHILTFEKLLQTAYSPGVLVAFSGFVVRESAVFIFSLTFVSCLLH